jgi:tetratricopeptide (TPR) repeat protein
LVQQQFDRAVAMLHSFFYPETDKAFRAIAEREPSCAMAYWGIAISQRANPLTPPFPAANMKQGWDSIQRARAAATATRRERDWIDALAPFFESYETVALKTRTSNYAAAMAALSKKYPTDREASVFYALALLEAVDLTDKTYASQLRAAAILERVAKSAPDHPGVVHYLIHAYDYAPLATKGLPAARRYASLASSAPHAAHMPSHIFSMLGMWPDAIRSNLAADAANLRYAATVNPSVAATPSKVAARYHALDFLVNAYLQLAQDRKAKQIVDERNALPLVPPEERITIHTGYAAIPVRYAIERGAWAEAASLPPMSTPFKQAEAIVWFGRALGAARSGDAASAKTNLGEISRLRQGLADAGDAYWAEQVAIQEQAVAAWIGLVDNEPTKAVALMRDAADREERTEKSVAMENRLSPMRELLGELLVQAGQAQEALEAFEASLKTTPKRFRSLAGAAQSAALSGRDRLAVSYYSQLLRLAATADAERPALTDARNFVKAHARAAATR